MTTPCGCPIYRVAESTQRHRGAPGRSVSADRFRPGLAMTRPGSSDLDAHRPGRSVGPPRYRRGYDMLIVGCAHLLRVPSLAVSAAAPRLCLINLWARPLGWSAWLNSRPSRCSAPLFGLACVRTRGPAPCPPLATDWRLAARAAAHRRASGADLTAQLSPPSAPMDDLRRTGSTRRWVIEGGVSHWCVLPGSRPVPAAGRIPGGAAFRLRRDTSGVPDSPNGWRRRTRGGSVSSYPGLFG